MPRGRKPKPTKVKELAGNPGKRPLNKLEPLPEGDIGLPPSYFSALATVIWQDAVNEAPKGLLTGADRAILEVYCSQRAIYQQAAEENMTRGSVCTDAKGERKVAPEITVMQKAALLMARACAELGFTPSSRGRINYESPQGGGNEFGDV